MGLRPFEGCGCILADDMVRFFASILLCVHADAAFSAALAAWV
jgi:hypothetical protein